MKSSNSCKLALLPPSFAWLLLSPLYNTSHSLCLSLCFYRVFLSCLHSDSLNKSVTTWYLIMTYHQMIQEGAAGMGMISKRTNKEACWKWKVRTRHQRFFIYDFKAHNTIVQFLSSFSFDPSSSPCYIHFPFLLQQLRDRKLYLISTWVKTLLNSWAFWHKSQTSASPKVKLKYDREKKRRGWSKEPRVLLGCMYGKCKSLQ